MNFETPQKHELTDAEQNYNKELTKGSETPQELGLLAAEIRRCATSIMPSEINQIQDEKVKGAIEKSFIKVGEDIGTLAGIIEKMLANKM